MRKEYGNALRKIFKIRLKEIAPEYTEIKIKEPVYPGQRAFQWIAENGIYCFIILVPHPKWDNEFTFELGWSKLGKFPTIEELGSMWPSLSTPNSNHDEFKLPQYVCRIGNITFSGDKWWRIGENWIEIGRKIDINDTKAQIAHLNKQAEKIPEEKADAQVNAALDEALPVLTKVGLPYLEKLIQ